MLLGQKLIIWTDHKNLTYPNTTHANDRVLRQRLAIEEFDCEFRHIAGTANSGADALSRLPQKTPYDIEELQISNSTFYQECFAVKTVSTPIDYKRIAEEQQNDDDIQANFKAGRVQLRKLDRKI